jgi:hypothetical protein
MSTRYIIAAALIALTGAAQADVLPASSAPQAGVLTGWTTGNGTNVMGSGAMGDAALIAGVSHGAGSDAMIQALYDKVSANVGAAGDMKVSLKKGVDGVYLTGLSYSKAAALAGNGMSVVRTTEGFKIVAATAGTTKSGGGASQGAPAGFSAAQSTPAGFNNVTINTAMTDAPVTRAAAVAPTNPTQAGAGGANADTGGTLVTAADVTGEVPEPSTIALMLAGLAGAVSLRRRAR